MKTDRDVRITGKYALELRDLNRFNETKEIEATAGTAEGSLDLQGRQGQGFKVETTGVVRDGQFLWKGLTLRASTDYAFSNGTVAFDRLLLRSAGTSLILHGKAQKHLVSLKVQGALDGRHITQLFCRASPWKDRWI